MIRLNTTLPACALRKFCGGYMSSPLSFKNEVPAVRAEWAEIFTGLSEWKANGTISLSLKAMWR